MSKPSVLDYLDIHLYLKDVYKYNKRHILHFSYDLWAQELRLKSRAYLRSVIIGEKTLSPSLTPQFVEYFNFNDLEIEHFLNLVQLKNCEDEKLKVFLSKKVLHLWKKNIEQVEIENLDEFLSDPLVPVIYTYLSFDDSPSRFEDIIKDTQYSPDKIKSAIRCLVWQKLIDGQVLSDGTISYKTIAPYFSVQNHPGSQTLKKFHLKNLRIAHKASQLPSDLRKYYVNYLALDENQFKELQLMIQQFNQEVLKKFDSQKRDQKKIYQINLQAFPSLLK